VTKRRRWWRPSAAIPAPSHRRSNTSATPWRGLAGPPHPTRLRGKRWPCDASRTGSASERRRCTNTYPTGRPRSRPHAVGFEEAAAAFDAATDGAAELLADLVTAYRAFVRRHPQPYRLMTEGPLPREQLAPGVEDRAAAALVRAAGSPERARAAFAFIHSMLILELNGRFPDDGGLEPAWRTGLAAFDSPALVARPQ
jgi:hypothetical protein